MPPGRPGFGASWIIAAACLVGCPATDASAGAPPSAYEAVVDQYRTGDTDAAVAVMLGWNRARLASDARPGALPRDAGTRAAAAALHTEAAIRHTSVLLSAVHFEIARAGVAGLDLNSDTRSFRRAWYVTAVAHLVSWGGLPQARRIIDRMPRDVAETPEAHAVVGLYHEAAAAPPSTTHAAPRELAAAAGHYQAALSGRPGSVHTRLRLGRVLLLLGRAGEAIAEFDRVSAETSDASLNYLVRLFQGEAHERAGRLEVALSRYRAAVDLVPDGHAANLSLGRALLLTGRRPEAAAVAARMLATDVPAAFPPERDPWWSYRRCLASPIDLELAGMRKAVQR